MPPRRLSSNLGPFPFVGSAPIVRFLSAWGGYGGEMWPFVDISRKRSADIRTASKMEAEKQGCRIGNAKKEGVALLSPGAIPATGTPISTSGVGAYHYRLWFGVILGDNMAKGRNSNRCSVV